MGMMSRPSQPLNRTHQRGDKAWAMFLSYPHVREPCVTVAELQDFVAPGAGRSVAIPPYCTLWVIYVESVNKGNDGTHSYPCLCTPFVTVRYL